MSFCLCPDFNYVGLKVGGAFIAQIGCLIGRSAIRADADAETLSGKQAPSSKLATLSPSLSLPLSPDLPGGHSSLLFSSAWQTACLPSLLLPDGDRPFVHPFRRD